MNVEVENLPNCIASLHIELPPDFVTKERNEVIQDFRRVARIPGFRPGKAPNNVVEAKFRLQSQIPPAVAEVGATKWKNVDNVHVMKWMRRPIYSVMDRAADALSGTFPKTELQSIFMPPASCRMNFSL